MQVSSGTRRLGLPPSLEPPRVKLGYPGDRAGSGAVSAAPFRVLSAGQPVRR